MTKVIHIRDAPDGWEHDTQYVYIGRAGRGLDGYFGNPFTVDEEKDRRKILQQYLNYFERKLDQDTKFYSAIHTLKDKTLVCFCKPNLCHGDIIVEYLEGIYESN